MIINSKTYNAYEKIFLILLMLFLIASIQAKTNNTILVETESFTQKGGWGIDQQSMDVAVVI
jgi:hypothetical protein